MPRAAERVSRRELKQDDAFVEAMTPLVDQLEKNWKTIAISVAGALAVVLGAVTFLTISAHHDEQSAALLGNALQDATKQVVGPSADEAKRCQRREGREGRRQRRQERGLLSDGEGQAGGACQGPRRSRPEIRPARRPDSPPPSRWPMPDYRQGKYEEAFRSYSHYLTEAPENDTLRAFAMEGQAYALLGEGKGDDALAAAKKLTDSPPASFGRDLGLLATGHIAEQLGKPDAAKDAYSKLSLDYPNTPAGREAND